MTKATAGQDPVFKRHRSEYYRLLGAIRTEGDWEGWTAFFLEGVSTIAQEAVQTTRDLFTAITTLVEAGVLVETTGRKRDRTFHYKEYLEKLRVGTELEPE